MKTYPAINLDSLKQILSPENYAIAEAIVTTQGRHKGCLRSSKPKNNSKAAYVWRMVAFQISPNPQHHCMPVCADFDLYDVFAKEDQNYKVVNQLAKQLDKEVVDPITNTVPKEQWYGIMRWGRALGYL